MLEKRIKTIEKQMKNNAPVYKVKELFEKYLISYMKLKDELGITPTKQDIENYSKLFHSYIEYINKKVKSN